MLIFLPDKPDLPPSFRMTLGHPDSKLSYPGRMAFYPISVRLIKLLPSASFRFPVTRDTLAFGYGIPVITAPSGLAPFRLTPCPAHLILNTYGVILKTVRRKTGNAQPETWNLESGT